MNLELDDTEQTALVELLTAKILKSATPRVVCYASLAETGSASLSAMSSCFRASCSSRAFTFTVVAFAANERKWAACRW